MRDPKPRKWVTWEIPKEFLKKISSAEEEKLIETIMKEAEKALEDMFMEIPVSFKITNMPKEF